MAVRIYLEIGHEASIRNKKTQGGFTHDWEVFVRGCEGVEIHYYVEKVVFYLHETFPKPKRVVKEPPYSVKESGYAGFNLPIDIYLRNGNEPKKISFNYDLHLQHSGPAILKVRKEKYVFNAPSEDFKLKLLKGGGTIVTSANIQEVNDTRSTIDDKNQMMSKPKFAGGDLAKRPKIKTSEPYNTNFQELFGSPIMTSSKPASDQKIWKDPKNTPKPDKGSEKARTKHSPHKDGHKDKEKDKSKDKGDSEKKSSKEEKKSKEKVKDRDRNKDKGVKRERSPRPNSPSPKRSPKRSPSRLSSPPVSKHKEAKQHDKRDKSEDKKSKKEKRSKEHKENKHSDEQKLDEHKDKGRGESKKDVVKVKTETPSPPQLKVVEKKEKLKEKSKEERSNEKHSEKYKSKKKDKEKRDKKEEKYKNEKKLERPAPPPQPPVEIKPATFIKSEPPLAIKKEKAPSYQSLIDDDSSNSSMSSSASSNADRKSRIETKMKEEKNAKLKKEKGYEANAIKCKRKSNSPERDEEPAEKKPRDNHLNNNSDVDQEMVDDGKTFVVESPDTEDDYINVLRDLQLKIMALKDHSDLQKVVQLIAETGRYEVSAHTFDFDLCLLDRSTVQQLQNFFANES